MQHNLQESIFSGGPPKSHFTFRNVYFLDDMEGKESPQLMSTGEPIPEHMHILTHTQRAQNYSYKLGHAKSIIRTDQVTAVHNHLPFL